MSKADPSGRKLPAPRIGARRRARECALQILYQLDATPPGQDVAETLDLFWQHVDPEAAQNRETVTYAGTLVRGVLAHREEIDDAIHSTSQHWRLERMPRVDRNVLRLGAYELLYEDVAPRIVINEAIELAKAFGAEESGGFVNGILDKLSERGVRH